MLHMLLELVSSKFLIFALHLSNTGSFPPPLTSAQEQEYLQAHAAGDKLARDKLIEHNLRLVVHVIKNSYNKQKGSVSGFWHTNHASGQAFYL
ncbi:MAG: hypothetical protein FWB76_01735 [Oscillospiraceae bacterium]|nr:hypothetical protein [Oscillospiraceae bacterium]